MKTTRDFECEDGETVRVEYDEHERQLLKTTLSPLGEVKEWIEYRYSRSSPLVEWKWFDKRGALIRSFTGEMRDGDIAEIKQSDDVDWKIPPESRLGADTMRE